MDGEGEMNYKRLKSKKTLYFIIFCIIIILCTNTTIQDKLYLLYLDKESVSTSYSNTHSSSSKPNPDEIEKIKVISHRATCVNEPENSLDGINASIKNKVDYAEIDVQETKDGVVILMHDQSLKRLTGLNKEANQLNYSDIEKLSIASTFPYKARKERIPTLDQVIKDCNGNLKLIIEIKPFGNTKDLTNKVVNIIEKNNFVNQCKIHSLSYDILSRVKSLDSNIETGYIVTRPVKNLSLLKVNFYSVKQNLITEKLVESIHGSNRLVYAWTIDNAKDMNNTIKYKVDGIITDKPGLLLNLKKINAEKL